MKRNIILAVTAMLLCASVRAETIRPADGRITKIGRTVALPDGGIVLNWSATTLCIEFNGRSLSLRSQDSHLNYYNVWIDREPSAEADLIFKTTPSDSMYVLASKLKNGRHVVYVQKRTEGRLGNTVFKEFTTDGTFLQGRSFKPRMIEFIGDSLTAAYGSEGLDPKEKYKPETQNPAKGYAQILARYFDADVIQLGHSGMGVTRNNAGKMAGTYMDRLYPLAIDVKEHPEYEGVGEGALWDPSTSGFKPELTVIFLGANDFSGGVQPSYQRFEKRFVKLLEQVKSNYGPDHKILCVAYQRDTYIFEYIAGSIHASALKNVFCMAESKGVMFSDKRDLGSSSHPNYNGHMKYAYTLIPYIATICGWDVKPL